MKRALQAEVVVGLRAFLAILHCGPACGQIESETSSWNVKQFVLPSRMQHVPRMRDRARRSNTRMFAFLLLVLAARGLSLAHILR
jgi:hypothetical protein